MKKRYTTSLLFICLCFFACKNKKQDVKAEPVISNFSPRAATKNTLITIDGAGFGNDVNKVQAYINTKQAEVVSVAENAVSVKVPVKANSGFIKLVVDGVEAVYAIPFEYLITNGISSTYIPSSAMYASAMSFTADNKLIVADYANHKILQVDSTVSGVNFKLIAGSTVGYKDSAVGSFARFKRPTGLAIDAQGNIYVADSENHRIRKISPTLNGNYEVSTLAGGANADTTNGIGVAARFKIPYGITLNNSGQLIVADRDNDRLRKISTVTKAVSNYITKNLQLPIGVAMNEDGTGYVLHQGNYRVKKIFANGTSNDYANTFSANFGFVVSMAIDKVGNLYLADKNGHKIYMISFGGYLRTLLGAGAPGNLNTYYPSPEGIAVDKDGIVYFHETSDNSIRKIVFE
jgi:sugar lactone lactonase YvrE